MKEPASPENLPHSTPLAQSHPWRFYVLAGVLLLLDQLSKYLAATSLAPGHSLPVLGPVLSLTLSYNSGTAMGLLPMAGRSLAIVAAVFALVLLVWGRRYAAQHPWLGWGCGLLLGGAVGNLTDRVRFGYVVDFLDLHVWPVFNVADVGVVCGAALIVLHVAFNPSHRPSGCRRS